MSKKPISWLELIKLKLNEAKGSSMKDIMPVAKKEWAQIKAGSHSLYTQGKAQTFARKKKNTGDNTKKTRKSMKNSSSASPSARNTNELEEMLAHVKLCNKCKKKVDKAMGKKKPMKGGDCGCNVQNGGCVGSCGL